jgi:hypothetical protein
MRGLQSRLNLLAANGGDVDLRSRLETERARHAQRYQLLSQLLSRVQQYIAQLHGHTPLEMAGEFTFELKDKETLSSAIASLRGEIKALQAKLASVKSAPLPLSDKREHAAAFVASLGARTAPLVSFQRDELKVGWPQNVDMLSPDFVIGVMCWASPDSTLRALERAILQQAERAGRTDALGVAEREKRLRKLERQLSECEMLEESMIQCAGKEGLDVPRRVDADPRCVLGLVVVAKTSAAA